MAVKRVITALILTSITVMFCSCSTPNTKQSSVYNSKFFTDTQNSFGENTIDYQNTVFNFKVAIPKSFETEMEKYKKATSESEGSPDGGIVIYPDENKDNLIRIFGSSGTVNTSIIDFTYSDETTEDFVTESGIKGKLYYNDTSDYKEAVLILDSHHAAQMKLTSDIFNNNKNKIYAILKSIDIC